MKIGIDASNIHGGGGVTHLAELLGAADPRRHGFTQIVVWACRATLDSLPECSWLQKVWDDRLESGFIRRAWWQRTELGKEVRLFGCDVLFVPGGSVATQFTPVVTMSRNMLPFEWSEMLRFGVSLSTLKFFSLRLVQGRSFRNAAGVIYLTKYARDAVAHVIGQASGNSAIIPHGVDDRFVAAQDKCVTSEELSSSCPFRLLYVSRIDAYKHQGKVAVAISSLRAAGVPVTIDFIGSDGSRSARKLRHLLRKIDPDGAGIRIVGPISHGDLHRYYGEADGFVFASSCENLPNILLEAMAAGLPIACSDRGPMPELLGNCGLYFDPLVPSSIECAIRELLESAERRNCLGDMAQDRARQYSWHRCADDTFAFLRSVSVLKGQSC